MHFAFVPVVTDKKRGDLKVSAKELITRKHLQDFHPRLDEHMEKVFGRSIDILNEATKEGNKSIKELKEGTAINQLGALKSDLKASKSELAMINMAEREIKAMGQIKAIENRFFNKGYVQIKKDTFEQFKNMAKNYRKDTVAIRKANTTLQDKVKNLENKVEQLTIEKDRNIKKMNLEELKERAETRNQIRGLEKKVEALSSFIVSKDLADEFNQSLEKNI